jgi:hypothetical protein
MMRFTWIDTEIGEKDENLFGANGQNDWDKGVGSALTYAERYFLLKYFHIATDEDDIDNPNRKPEEAKTAPAAAPTQPQAKPASDAQVKMAKDLWEKGKIVEPGKLMPLAMKYKFSQTRRFENLNAVEINLLIVDLQTFVK